MLSGCVFVCQLEIKLHNITFPHVVVFSTLGDCPADDDKCKNCDAILAELENIDDEADDAGIHFVKTMDTAFAKSMGIHAFPTVVYFEDSVPIVYNGKRCRSVRPVPGEAGEGEGRAL